MIGLPRFARRSSTFPRGVHPLEAKELAREGPIEVLPTPKSVRIPLLQNLGAPCTTTVEPRAQVALGDPVGEPSGFIGAPVHASVAGKVEKPSVDTLPNGRHVPVVPIRAGEQTLEGEFLLADVLGGEWPVEEVDRHPPDAIADAAFRAGLVGLGGAAFPTHVKLRRRDDRPVDTLLINGCECEPYLTADERLMLEAPDALVLGALLARRATGAERVILGIEDNKPEALEILRERCAGTALEVRALRTKYPQGGERQLVVALTGRVVPMAGLPLDTGIVVLNVSTCAALARAVHRGKPLTHRVVTVSGRGIARPGNVLAPVGASHRALIEFRGGLTRDAVRVLAGGPMMGFTVANLDTPITKGTSGITVLTEEETRVREETACVRCGRCVDVCPLNLVPTRIALAARAGNASLAERHHASACMECGCCAFECPAGLPLVQLLRLAKVLVSAKAQKP